MLNLRLFSEKFSHFRDLARFWCIDASLGAKGAGGGGCVGSLYYLNTLRTEAMVNNLQLPSPPRVSISLAGQNLARDSFSSFSPSLWWIGYMLVLL